MVVFCLLVSKGLNKIMANFNPYAGTAVTEYHEVDFLDPIFSDGVHSSVVEICYRLCRILIVTGPYSFSFNFIAVIVY